jgi:hypothetical protein
MSVGITALFENLPGADLIAEGLEDLAKRRDTIAAELVKIGSPRLRDCGVNVEVTQEDALNADHRLYDLLRVKHGRAAHSQYNALLGQLVSFERALEHRVRRLRLAHSPKA